MTSENLSEDIIIGKSQNKLFDFDVKICIKIIVFESNRKMQRRL